MERSDVGPCFHNLISIPVISRHACLKTKRKKNYMRESNTIGPGGKVIIKMNPKKGNAATQHITKHIHTHKRNVISPDNCYWNVSKHAVNDWIETLAKLSTNNDHTKHIYARACGAYKTYGSTAHSTSQEANFVRNKWICFECWQSTNYLVFNFGKKKTCIYSSAIEVTKNLMKYKIV